LAGNVCGRQEPPFGQRSDSERPSAAVQHGCKIPAIAACEQRVLADLLLPSTYKLIDASMDTAQFEEDDATLYVRGSGCEIARLGAEECRAVKCY
jgi:hypothetical protein